jgi:hypothetical protein
MPLVAPLVVTIALASLTASPAARPASQLTQLPQGTKVVTLRCTPAPAPAPTVDKDALRPPSGPTGSSEMQVGTFATDTAQAATVIDLGPCPQELAADEPQPEPEPETTTTPTGKPADEQGLDDAERARREQADLIRRMLEEMNRRSGGVMGGMTR